MQSRSKLKSLLLFREIAGLIREGVLATEPGPRFPFERIGDAVREAEVVGRKGKVLLTP